MTVCARERSETLRTTSTGCAADRASTIVALLGAVFDRDDAQWRGA